jgi:hypothetical protein
VTQLPPPERPPSHRRPLNSDDWIGILVAFASIGGIFFWAISRDNQGFNFSIPEQATTQPTSSPVPWVDSSPATRPTMTAPPRSTNPGVIAPVDPSPRVAPVPVPVPIQPASPQVAGFSDVSSNYWATPFLEELARQGVIQRYPDGTFQPDKSITRAEFADMLDRAFDQPQQRGTMQFSDVPTGFWATTAIDQAVQMGFMNGYPGNVFRPEQVIPKYQALIALATGLSLQTPQNPTQTLVYYQDANQLPSYTTVKVAAATNAGLVVNYPELTRLQPNQDMTRAEAAALIYQALVHTGKVSKVNSVYIVSPQP